MRPLLVLFALAGATSASAQVVQDRYGPPRRPSPMVIASLNATPQGAAAPAAAEPYSGPMLRWASKRAAAPEPADSAPPPAPRPSGPNYLPPSAPLPPSLFAPPASPAKFAKPYGPEAAAAPPPAAPRAAPAPRVASAKPAPPAIQAAQPKPAQPAAQAAAPSPTPAQPTRLAAAAPATPRTVGATPRFYSLHREYGMAPDHIPEQSSQPRYVLIGPPDGAKPPTGDDDDSNDKTKASKSSAVF